MTSTIRSAGITKTLLIGLLVAFCAGCGRPYTDAEKKKFEEHRDDPTEFDRSR